MPGLRCATSMAVSVMSLASAWAATPVSSAKPKNPSEVAVVEFLDMTFNQKHFDEAFNRFVGPYYRQHNPTVPDGKEPILKLLHQFMPSTPDLHYDFRNVWSDGDRVIVHSHVTTGATDRGKAVIDIFRLEKGRIVEHWDVAKDIPEHAENANTMF
jgi:predicted SnoaL-like aldol condensation-catalyzing enzyme